MKIIKKIIESYRKYKKIFKNNIKLQKKLNKNTINI